MSRAGAGRATLLLLAGLGLAGAGCDTDAYCFSGCEDGAGGEAGSGGAGGQGGQGGGFTSTGTFGQGGSEDCGDTQSSLENCGECGKKCELAGAVPVCVMGDCVIQACLAGQYDVDGVAANGCEYACPVPDPDIELCDGIDNDCDALVDAADPDLVQPTGLCNQTAGTPCEQTTLACNGADGWSCVYPPEVETVAGFVRENETLCDGLDGNRDEAIDEWFVDLGTVCDDGAFGQCRDYGIVVCDPMNANQTTCDLSAPPDADPPSPEACDAVDNDCNGLVDDALPPAAFAMAALPSGGGILVDRYEASRPDSTSVVAGIDESVACSKPGVVPWTGGGYAEAEAACASRGPGYRLCTLAELEDACRGANDTLYPYGDTYDPAACNGFEQAGSTAMTTGSLASCATVGDPIFDASGNLAEWTSTQTNAGPAPNRIFALSGGSYLSPELGLACTIELVPRALESTLLPSIGFRCCFGP